ncbi:MBG domain-containing protein, partial [Flavobacterium sp. LS1P3]|uniref:MBG domain-containing protein n=1 Tax=Flavobacterium sp. LS1P3 TaxID=3401720 RepID=UPI003AAA5CEC
MKKKLPQTNVRSVENCYLLIFIIFLLSISVYAEGTPTLSPNANNITAVLSAPDLSNGSYFNAPEDNRIYFNIANASTENLYFGFDWREFSVGNPGRLNNLYYRIRRPDGTVAVTALWNSANGVAGSIDSHARALAGPNIGSITNGYSPLVFDPTVSGEHWIEIFRSNDGGITALTSSADRAVGALFDMTVANNSGSFGKKNGRLHSDKWGFVAVSSTYGNTTTATSEPNFYAYTADRVVLFIDFKPGFQPIAFNVAVNSYGVSQSGDYNIDRRSISAAKAPSLLNGYKVFLNNPDSNLYPVASIPAAPTFLNPAIINCGPYLIRFNISEPGDVKLLFNLNGVSGYQAGTSDRILEALSLPVGDNSISWDGLDGLGNVVNDGATVNLTLNFLKGRFNLPIYDVELNINGFNVSSIAPIAIANSQMFWDDSQLTNVGTNCSSNGSTQENNLTGAGLDNSLAGTASPARAWSGNGNLLQTIPAPANGSNETDGITCNDFGNVRLLNTWGWGLTSASVSTNIFKGCSDLKVVKTVSNSSPTIGSDVTFTITASNLGISNDTNVVVNDAIPNGYTVISITPSVGTWSAPNWTIGNFASGATATLTVVAKVKNGGTYANTATISGTNNDPVSNNNTYTSTPIPVNSIIDAINDIGTPVNGFNGGTAFTNVLTNDTVNNDPVITSQVNTTFVSSTNAGITLSGTNVIVAAGTPAGSYSLVYRICEILNPANCDNATVTVTVTAPVIDAINDAGTVVYGATAETAFTNVLSNDKLNGVVVVASKVNTTFVSATNTGITLSGTDVIVAAGTPAGSYSLVYRICEILNPTNCDNATVTVTVTPKAIDVVVTADDKTKVYGDLNPALTAVVTGAVNGDTINYTLATSATQFSNVGAYPIVVTLGSNPNYDVTPVNGTLTVTPKAIDVVVTADDKTKVYGDLNPALTAVVTGAVNGDTINYTLATSATQFSNVGAYPIVVTL